MLCTENSTPPISIYKYLAIKYFKISNYSIKVIYKPSGFALPVYVYDVTFVGTQVHTKLTVKFQSF